VRKKSPIVDSALLKSEIKSRKPQEVDVEEAIKELVGE